MFKKVLVGKPWRRSQLRIIRALREMDITSVAIFSEADRNALHTELADEAICIGPAGITPILMQIQSLSSVLL